jgi:hypothetical protein
LILAETAESHAFQGEDNALSGSSDFAPKQIHGLGLAGIRYPNKPKVRFGTQIAIFISTTPQIEKQ